DHAGQARLDQEVGRLDEGLEADQSQTGEFHSNSVPSCSPKWAKQSNPLTSRSRESESTGAASARRMNRQPADSNRKPNLSPPVSFQRRKKPVRINAIHQNWDCAPALIPQLQC